MDELENPGQAEEGGSTKEKLVKTLHNKAHLSSLRTYQGDMAEFIKEKNESVISIAVKEKEKKEEKLKLKQIEQKEEPAPTPQKDGLQVNLTILLSSLVLLVGGSFAFVYVFKFISLRPEPRVEIEQEIIPYNTTTNITNATKESLPIQIAEIKGGNGINLLKISGQNGKLISKSQDFFSYFDISLPNDLWRTLSGDYAFGTITQESGTVLPFIVIKVDDFGRSFSAMLEWEKTMKENLFLLNPSNTNSGNGINIWKDVIVKNKDTRALVDERSRAILAYTFLDKNTILISNSFTTIENMSQAYASRPVVR